jgi:hypothetical protein
LKDKYLDKTSDIPLKDIVTQASTSVVEKVNAQDGEGLGLSKEFLFLRFENCFSKILDNSSSEAFIWKCKILGRSYMQSM